MVPNATTLSLNLVSDAWIGNQRRARTAFRAAITGSFGHEGQFDARQDRPLARRLLTDLDHLGTGDAVLLDAVAHHDPVRLVFEPVLVCQSLDYDEVIAAGASVANRLMLTPNGEPHATGPRGWARQRARLEQVNKESVQKVCLIKAVASYEQRDIAVPEAQCLTDAANDSRIASQVARDAPTAIVHGHVLAPRLSPGGKLPTLPVRGQQIRGRSPQRVLHM